MVTKNIKYFLMAGLVSCGVTAALTSCSNMLETDSELVEFESDNTLNHTTDSVYSVMGIINKLQVIADRSVLLGSARGALMTCTDAASNDLKRLSNFDLTAKNKYNVVSDYYAVINNCNYYLERVDTAMNRRGRKLFLPEYAVVKSYRAWTYLQLAMNYGKVPLVLKPILTEKEAQEAMQIAPSSIQDICDTFIADLTPLVGVNLPEFGNITGWGDSKNFMIPMRALLGDLCLWGGHYKEAARWYHDYLTYKESPVAMSNQRSTWGNSMKLEYPSLGYSTDRDIITFIPMERRVFDGIVSQLEHIYNSTQQNNYFYEMEPSQAMRRISAAQTYCFEEMVSNKMDTIYASKVGFNKAEYVGDLRLASNYSLSSHGQTNEYSEYNSYRQNISKVTSTRVSLYRATMIYLRYAEALNRAGYPQSAMAVLKYGMCNDNMKKYVDEAEREEAGDLVYFDPTFDEFKPRYDEKTGKLTNICGVHSLGSGDSQANKYYVMPQPESEFSSRRDTIDYQIPLVEDMIITEMALEGAFEGNHYYDLMRVALRRGDAAYLADPVSSRNSRLDGEYDATLRSKLMDQNNWYLPLP